MNRILLLSLLALGYQTASAASLLETFGTGTPNVFTMEFVTIGNPGNAADTTGSPNPAGSVAYTYNIGKYEVSRDMITKANSAGSLRITMAEMGIYGGNGLLKPATGISWYEAATYVNWLNTSTGGTAAYKFVGGTFQLWSSTDAGYNANNMFRNSLAKYWLPSSNEWYKAAYGNLNGTWNNYATGSDSAPTAVASGTGANTAVYTQSGPDLTGPADITSAGGLSPYGTMGQGGNVWEWNETAQDGINNTVTEYRGTRGGQYASDGNNISSSVNGANLPTYQDVVTGFRVASVPEPSALSLLAIGLGGLALVRRRK
jgi:formylglycine-generating enzyme required for sulfatase activity